MPIDRAAALRNADKLLRQGKLDEAIAEYLRVVEDQPRDWNTANLLGDLYLRAGQVDDAVEQFVRVASSLTEEGFLPKAGALYKKVLKIKPDDEHALLQAAEIAATQGLLVEARSYLTALGERRWSRGDQPGVAQIKIRLASLDPSDYDGRFAAARARVEINDVAGALHEFKELATELSERGRQAEAIGALREASLLTPDDNELRGQLLNVYLAAGDFARARQCATTAGHIKRVAAQLEAVGQSDEALAAWTDAARLDPADADLRAQLARAFVSRRDFAAAADYLTEDSAGNDARLLLIVAEIQLRNGKLDEGLAVARRLLGVDPLRRQDVAMLGWTLAEQAPELGHQLVELSADVAVAESDWASAAAALQEFVTRVPNHVPALMRLVEVCVDGGLEATMYSAQAQLADAYIASGSATEAMCLSEDLVAREPWDRANIERFRRALILTGEPEPDALIADRLSGNAPFMSTDLSYVADTDLGGIEASSFEPAAASAASPTAHERSNRAEVDLSVSLDGADGPDATPPDVFTRLRDSSRAAVEAAEHEYERGMTLYEAGQIDDCVQPLQAASYAPRFRFTTGAVLGRIFRDSGRADKAVEWFERAAQAPATTAEEGQLLLYDLADALESIGEPVRALAVCLELQAEAGDYRDLAARVDRLTKAQDGG